MPNEISERASGPSCTLNVRIDRQTASLLRSMASGPQKIGQVIEKLVASEVSRREERRRITEAIAAI